MASDAEIVDCIYRGQYVAKHEVSDYLMRRGLYHQKTLRHIDDALWLVSAIKYNRYGIVKRIGGTVNLYAQQQLKKLFCVNWDEHIESVRVIPPDMSVSLQEIFCHVIQHLKFSTNGQHVLEKQSSIAI